LSKGGNVSPPFGRRPERASSPEGKGRLGGILQDDFKQLLIQNFNDRLTDSRLEKQALKLMGFTDTNHGHGRNVGKDLHTRNGIGSVKKRNLFPIFKSVVNDENK
jgi:hypothetical protein